MDSLRPGDQVTTPYGLGIIVNALTWRKNEIFAYRVELASGALKLVVPEDVERAASFADLAWAAAKVRAVIANQVMP
jgi:hypothetical protein